MTKALQETTGPIETKRARRLDKDLSTFPGKVAITVLGGSQGRMIFDPADLPGKIRENLIPFGLGHKLGDAAAGKSGTDAEEAILKVWEGIKSGDWTVRPHGGRNISPEALKWLRSAADHGDAEAQRRLGTMYGAGKGVPRDYLAAYMWLSLAAVQGDEGAKNELNIAESMLTHEQRREAQKLVREWRKNQTI
jgi:TPR repeat protein